jgi:hypothetical protein
MINEFDQLSNDFTSSLNEKEIYFRMINDNEFNGKGGSLVKSSAIKLNNDNENQIERLLETINRY